MKNHQKHWIGLPCLAVLVSATLLLGFSSPRDHRWRPLDTPLPGTPFTYVRGATIVPSPDEVITLRRGDMIILQFPCASQIVSTASYQRAPIGNNPDEVKITVEDAALLHDYLIPMGCQSTTPSFILRISDDVLPGDANADGVINMDDLIAIGEGISRGAILHSASNYLTYPPNLSEMNQLYPVEDWIGPNGELSTFQRGSKTINFKHADCNFDGRIDRTDVEFLMAALEPLAPTQPLLVDNVTALQLHATVAETPILPSIVAGGVFGLEIPFKISLGEVPPTFGGTIVGMVFSRPVMEARDYYVTDTRFSFDDSQIFFIQVPKDILWRQHFWNLISLASLDNQCIGSVNKPLDVGIYLLNGSSHTPLGGDRVGNCTITLLDVLRAGDGGGILPVQVSQFITAGRVVTMNNGVTRVGTMVCTSDQTTIDPSIFCRNPPQPIMRDGIADHGNMTPVTDAVAWNSPDIWIRHSNDRGLISQNPIPGSRELVNVRVFNSGCQTMQNVRVNVYWTTANTSELWSRAFADPTGALVGTIMIPEIAAWQSATGQINWMVPVDVNTPIGSTPVYTLVAVVYQQGDPVAFTENFRSKVLSSNNIAARSSIILLDEFKITATASILFRNPMPNPMTMTLALTQIEGPEDIPVSQFGNLELFDLPAMSGDAASINMTAVNGPTRTYRLNADQSSGEVSFLPGSMIESNIGVRFNRFPSSLTAPIRYAYRLTMSVGNTIYSSSVLEITIPGA